MDPTLAEASHRLTLSRERMRLALRGPPSASGGGTSAPVGWLDSLKALPGAGLVVDAVQQWWRRHPLYVASQGIADGAKAVLQPLVQRHPFALVAGALVLGGLLAWSRPWRWALGSGVLAGMLPQVLAAVLHKPAAETPRREARWG